VRENTNEKRGLSVAKEQINYEKRIITIPNALSMFRIVLIPFIIWAYCMKKAYVMTAVLLVLSGLTDMVDGFIARHFHMISNVGKLLDPVADKLTQAAVMISLVTRFSFMLLPLVILILKEITNFTLGLIFYRKSGKVNGADWHGKVATCMLYAMMIVHVLWIDIPVVVSNVLIIISAMLLLLSFVLYGIKNIKLLQWDAVFYRKGRLNE
jgi:cardiolipin synthase